MSLPQSQLSADEVKEEKGSQVYQSSRRASPDPRDLKTAHDGHTILSPQPSTDPNDPLNWSVFKKHVFLFIIAITAFLPDYGSSTGAITNLVQPE